MSVGNGAPPDLHVPAGFSVSGQRGPVAPDSLVAKLNRVAERKRKTAELTVELPGWEGQLRATYGTVGLDDIERFQETLSGSNITASLQMMARACRSLEVLDDDGSWRVLEDDAGPVTFDDRLARKLGWPRPDETFTYTSRAVYQGVFDDNGFLIGQHVAQVARWMGLTEEGVMEAVGEASPTPRPNSSESPPLSATTPLPSVEPAPSSGVS
jgi:hypothetical protein